MVIKFLIFLFPFALLQSNQLDFGKINVITTNDIHGMIGEQEAAFMNPNFPPTIIGGSAYYKYVRDLENELSGRDKVILTLDGGNFFQGHPLGIVDSGKTMINWMNKIKYDAMVPGNTDFIYGYKNLVSLSKLAHFPFVASNIFYNNNDKHVFDPYTITTINGVKVGIIGVVSSDMNDIVLKKNIEGIYFTSEIDAVNKYSKELKEKNVDIVIVLSSLGIPWNREKVYDKFINLKDNLNNLFPDSNDDGSIYRKFIKVNNQILDRDYDFNSLALGYYTNDVDFIISGGISKGYRIPWYDNNNHTYIFQNYGNGTEFGHFEMKYDLNGLHFLGYENVVSNSITQTLFVDDFTFDKTQYNWIQDKMEVALNEVYGDIDWFSSIKGDKAVEPIDKSQSRIDLNNTKEDVSPTSNTPSRWDVPYINTEKIDIVTWNCEFFPAFGDSTIDALSEVVMDLYPDIIAFQEIKQRGWFDKLMVKLPDYDFIISEQSSFMDQAIIFKRDSFELVNRMEIFAENDYNFAGRPPLRCDLIYTPSSKQISLINLHMKCCDSGLVRRKRATQMLYEYIDKELEKEHKNFIVLGDWNDDLKDKPGEHCFDPFLNDSRFFFPTALITDDISQASYPKEPYVSFLDHIMVTHDIFGKKKEFDVSTIPMDRYMGGFDVYEKYISDHMPVYFSFE